MLLAANGLTFWQELQIAFNYHVKSFPQRQRLALVCLRALICIRFKTGEGYIPLKDVAERQDISLKYLEGIMSAL